MSEQDGDDEVKVLKKVLKRYLVKDEIDNSPSEEGSTRAAHRSTYPKCHGCLADADQLRLQGGALRMPGKSVEVWKCNQCQLLLLGRQVWAVWCANDCKRMIRFSDWNKRKKTGSDICDQCEGMS